MAKEYLTSSELMTLYIALISKDYGWEKRTEPERKVILTNPEALKNFGIMSFASTFRGTGHAEWEFLMGAWMVNAVREALDTGNECDITIVFNTEFLAAPREEGHDYRRFTKEQVYNHIIKFFTIQEDSDDVLRLAVRVNS